MTINGTATSRREHDLADLRDVLHGWPFPARQDDILAALVVGRAPSRLLWRARCLSPDRTYHSVDEMCTELQSLPQADSK